MARRTPTFQLALVGAVAASIVASGCGASRSVGSGATSVAATTRVGLSASSSTPAALDPVLESPRDAETIAVTGNRVVDTMVRWEKSVRDVFRLASDSLVERIGSLAPDLSVLTTDPIATMRTDESSGFGWRDDPKNKRRRQFHAGGDFRSKPGTPVLSAGNGVVVFTGWYYGYGNMIDVDHGGGVITRYAHLSRIETKKDATVQAGDQIGRVGMTGRTTGPHLHFEVRIDSRPVSPITAMTVANLQRRSPSAGRVAAFALSPELQSTALDGEDDSNRASKKLKESRPERSNRAKRSKVLW